MSKKHKQHEFDGAVNLPATAEPPKKYTPPPSPFGRKIQPIEWAGLAGVALFVLSIAGWLLSVPASGSQAYYSRLMAGDPFARQAAADDVTEGQGGH